MLLSSSLRRFGRRYAAWLAAAALAAGCAGRQPAIHYLGDGDMRYYRAQATEVDYPLVADQQPPELTGSAPPHTIRDRDHLPVRDFTLAEAIHTALMGSEIIRRYGDFLSPGNQLLQNPNFVPSVYDPAIQESGVLFGGRGVEAALAEFDATVNSSLVFGNSEVAQNVAALGPGATRREDFAQYQASLQKIFAYGGVVQLNQNINYTKTNAPGTLFDSFYDGNLEFVYQQPLLAGAGTEYTRTAGPIVQSFGGITGVSQGVLIARINNDISIADFEESVHNLVFDVETAYWDLYLAYRNFDTAVVARNSALDTWRLTAKQAGEVLIPADEAQARSALYAAEAATETARSNLYLAETRLRRLLGMPVNDGTVLRPIDDPVTAELVPDWYASLTDALTLRPDLRRQKWNLKSLELQLAAAEDLTMPRLDFISGYRVNAFGNDLLGGSNTYSSYQNSLAAGNQTSWTAGLQFNWPIGLRAAHAQVRNYELRLLKAQKVLAAQELEVGHELAAAFQEVARAHATMQSNYSRYVATQENVRGLEPRVLTEDNVDVILRAYERRAQAELAYYQSLVEYNQSLAGLQFRQGTILAYNSVRITEGPWDPEAYYEADRHAQARGHAFRSEHLESYPPDFATDAPAGRSVIFTSEAAAMPATVPPPVPGIAPVPDNAAPPAPGLDAEPPPPPEAEPLPEADHPGAAQPNIPLPPNRAAWHTPADPSPPIRQTGYSPPAATTRTLYDF